MWWLLGILAYFSVVLLSLLDDFQTPAGWVKRIFWPITVVVYLLGLILWILIWVPRNLFKGICFCFLEIKEFFVDIFRSAIKE